MLDLGSAVGYLLLDTSDLQSGFKKANEEMKTFTDKSKSMSDRLTGLSSSYTRLGTTFTKYVTLPLIGAGTAFTAFASESETAFSGYKAQVGDLTGDMEKYKDVMDEIYKNNYGEGYKDIANSMATITKYLGEMDPSAMQETTESALALRDTMGYEVPESIRTVDTLMKNFGMTAEEAFDYIVKGNQEGLDFSDEWLDSLNEYSVQFTKLGLDANDMFNIFKSGADSGAWNLDKIGDAVKEFSIRVVDGSDTTKHAFETLGYDFEDTMEIFAQGGEDAREVFFEMVTQLSRMDDEVQKNLVGTELFGTMWEDLGPEVIKQLSDMTSGAVDFNGAMDNLKDVKYDNLSNALGGLGRSLKSAGAELGEYLIPKVEAAIDAVNGLVDAFEAAPDWMKEMIVNFGLIAAAIGPVLLVIGKFVGFIAQIAPLISGAGGLTALLSSLGAAFSALAAPIAAVIAVIVALKTAWDTNFGGMRDTLTQFWSEVSVALSTIISFIQDAITSFLSVISSLWDSNWMNIRLIFEETWNTIETIFGNVITILTNTVMLFLNLFTGNWQGAWENIKTIFSSIWENIKSVFSLALDFILNLFGVILPSIGQAATNVIQAVKDAFSKKWEDIKTWFGEAINDPVNTILGIGGALYNAGAEIFSKLWDGLKSIWNSITSWVEEGLKWLSDKVAFWQNESAKISTESSSGSGGRGNDNWHSAGLDFVPYNGYPSRLHYGEEVLTANEAKEYRDYKSGRASGGDTFIFNSPQPINEVRAAREVRKVKREIAEDIIK